MNFIRLILAILSDLDSFGKKGLLQPRTIKSLEDLDRALAKCDLDYDQIHDLYRFMEELEITTRQIGVLENIVGIEVTPVLRILKSIHKDIMEDINIPLETPTLGDLIQEHMDDDTPF